MNTNNLEFLQNGLKYLGFDEKLGMELAKNISAEKNDFQLKEQKSYGNDKMDATLHFRKSDTNDMYFFNKYDATVTRRDEEKSQTFYIQKNSGVTLKEAYNLLSGRSVNKDLVNKQQEKYNAWMQLDFSQKDEHNNYKVKQYHTNYGYDLKEAVAKLPVKEFGDAEQREKLLKSLEKGNVQSVTFTKDGKEEKMFIEANPQFKSVGIYDAHMKLVKQENTKQDMKEGPAKTGELKQKDTVEIDGNGKATKKGLLPKKRESKNNGQGMH